MFNHIEQLHLLKCLNCSYSVLSIVSILVLHVVPYTIPFYFKQYVMIICCSLTVERGIRNRTYHESFSHPSPVPPPQTLPNTRVQKPLKRSHPLSSKAPLFLHTPRLWSPNPHAYEFRTTSRLLLFSQPERH